MKLAQPIETYLTAINAGDAPALQSSFADDAVVKDVGREIRGSAAIKERAAKEILEGVPEVTVVMRGVR